MAPSRWTTTAQAFLEDWRRSGEVSAAVAGVADEDGPRVLAAVEARHDSRFDLAWSWTGKGDCRCRSRSAKFWRCRYRWRAEALARCCAIVRGWLRGCP